MEVFDPEGNVILVFSVVLLFLLVLGLPLVRGINTKKNLIRHGILATVGLTLQTSAVVVTMIPVLPEISGEILNLQPTFALNTWLHIITGSAALVSGIVYSAMWLTVSASKMRCMQARKYMLPTLIVWIAALITGALIHLFQMV